ncbi:MAG TPA: hypothetical protein VMR25_01325 [Planctomycetaceae bacterium]|jgi:hypothetical protein|nr:hypothetical protein [Planctomycetaceae bacterium]
MLACRRIAAARLAIEPCDQVARLLVLETGRFDRHLPFELRVFGKVDHPHRALAQRPNDPIAAELPRQAGAEGLGGAFPHRLGHECFLAVSDERFGGVLRTIARNVDPSQLANLVFGGQE